MTTTSDSSDLTRSEYFAERALLLEARQRSYQRAEQMATAGAASALVLSVTFLEKLAPGQAVRDPRILVAAWVVLLVGLGTGLLSHHLSAKGFDGEIACLEARIHNERVPTNVWNAWNVRATITSMICLVLGIVLLARFAYVNAPFYR